MNDIKADFKRFWNNIDLGIRRIILINTVIFVLLNVAGLLGAISPAFRAGVQIFASFFLLPADLVEFILHPWTLLVYGFTHEGFFHFLFNMLILHWMSQFIVGTIGSNRVIAVYVWGVIAGGLAFLIAYNLLPMNSNAVLLGASAGVYAVTVAAATMHPNAKIGLFLIGLVKLKYIALFYIGISLLYVFGPNAGGNLAHLGGAALGYIMIVEYKKGRDWSRPVIAVMNFFVRIFVKSDKMKTGSRNKQYARQNTSSRGSKSQSGGMSAPSYNTKANQETIDRILDKISVVGYEKLSKEEKQILFQASQDNKDN
ncbi:MAG: rhomboid family intramembrane serine protease [Bernardetiaceae bacterium]|nr:rhomboid family intramembrane serine protease [Bernardetiaceae bacterium]